MFSFKNGRVLKNAPIDFKFVGQIVMEAVKQKGFAVVYASDAIKGDREVVMTTVKNAKPNSIYLHIYFWISFQIFLPSFNE